MTCNKDCFTAEWGRWGSCSNVNVEVLDKVNVGKQVRKRERQAGKFCIDSDLREVKLCRLGQDVLDGKNRQDKGGSGKHDQKPMGGSDVKVNQTKHSVDNVSSEETQTLIYSQNEELSNLIPGSILPVGSADQHGKSKVASSHFSTERAVFITLLCLTCVLLTSGSLLGLALVRRHKQLQRKHKILVMTRERIRLIDGAKIPVRQSGASILLCGVGGEAVTAAGGLLCGIGDSKTCGRTIQNPMFEDIAEEEELEAVNLSQGRLQLKLPE